MSNSTTVYLSYWHADLGWAMQIRRHLQIQGYRVFCDTRNAISGDWVLPDFVRHTIAASSHFLILLTPSYFYHCIDPRYFQLLRSEMDIALQLQRIFVPITFKWFRLENTLSHFEREGILLEALIPFEVDLDSLPTVMESLSDEWLESPQKIELTSVPATVQPAIDAVTTQLNELPRVSASRLRAENYYEAGFQLQHLDAHVHLRYDANERAVEYYDRALELIPAAELPLTMLDRAQAHITIGKSRNAASDIATFIQLAPNVSDGYFVRGKLCYADGDYENAIADLTNAIALESNWGEPYYYRAKVRLAMENLDGARRLRKIFGIGCAICHW